jgi:hypothetical protein
MSVFYIGEQGKPVTDKVFSPYSMTFTGSKYRVHINYVSILQNQIFTNTEQKYMMLLPFERGMFAVSLVTKLGSTTDRTWWLHGLCAGLSWFRLLSFPADTRNHNNLTYRPSNHTLYDIPPIRFVFQVTQKDLRSSLMMAGYCQNM